MNQKQLKYCYPCSYGYSGWDVGYALQFYVYFYQVRLGYPSSSEQRLKVLEKVSVKVLRVVDLAECE